MVVWFNARLTAISTRAMTASVILSSLVLAGCSSISIPMPSTTSIYDGDIQRGYVIDENAFAQVKPGASAQQALALMGSPSTTSTIGGDAWYYISQKLHRDWAFQSPKITDQHVLAIYFDKNKKVERVANYGLEDGKVIDFVTRTTPTSGQESSFIRNMLTNLFRFN